MTIKSKVSLYISIFFTLLFCIVSIFIVKSFSNFRQEEFEGRLRERAMSMIKLLVEFDDGVGDIKSKIDKTKIHELYNEKSLVFDPNYNLIYSNMDDEQIKWSKSDLDLLKRDQTFFKKEGENEIYGVFYDSDNKDYFALISANDSTGKRKVNYLIFIIIISGIAFISASWLVSFYLVKNQLKPLDDFLSKVKSINNLNQETKLEITGSDKNEINLLGIEFNYMIDRIREGFLRQKEFISHVSHEFRTPLARMSAKIENQMTLDSTSEAFLKNIFKDTNLLSELMDSLIILSHIDEKSTSLRESVRIDEAIFNSIDFVKGEFPELKVNFNISTIGDIEKDINIRSNQNLLEIALTNLLRNAYLYAEHKIVNIEVCKEDELLCIKISNDGQTLSPEERKNIFKPFVRGSNTNQSPGRGLGLRIVDRIAVSLGMKISYSIDNSLNTFTLKIY